MMMMIFIGIQRNTGLTSLNLALNTLGPSVETIDALSLALQANPTLVKINLDGNAIGDICLARLLTPLTHHNNRILELSVTPFVDNVLYRTLIDWLAANKPKPVKKRRVCLISSCHVICYVISLCIHCLL
jgi:hypothetical protein